MNYLEIIGRNQELFEDDVYEKGPKLSEIVTKSSFMVIGGAGSIGRAVVKEIFQIIIF